MPCCQSFFVSDLLGWIFNPSKAVHANVQGPPAHSLLHASGVIQDALVPKQTMSGVRAVFAAKVRSFGACTAGHFSYCTLEQIHKAWCSLLLAKLHDCA